ncbi:MAG: prepilin-type N-terminal cleavage/methylation domain-containing protein [Phycisphaerae bacterium]|jgi:prepilin-type N-terminal cleavage/methylation domain-containing protein|nr:prepilin-type N-terminal cleavage/methylation domain-containing protein [Phycisphaerae bacterium]MDP7636403.1 prepilin-type N-terminal cleavage/methylation domain-containing protein [Phycisphaerae bacterium]
MQTNRHNQARQTADRRTGGFTLLELMVAVAVISVMVLGFGAVLSQARRVVTTAERHMRADAAASAIARVIRRDMQNISKSGFLHIAERNLLLTTAGAAPSLTSNAIGTGSIISYGWPSDGNTFYRQGFVLQKLSDSYTYIPGSGDCMNLNFAEVQAMPSSGPTCSIDVLASEVLSYAPGNITYPPGNVADVNALWQLLVPYCSNLVIHYTNPNYDPTASPGDSDREFWMIGASNTWYNSTPDWPKAVRFTFTLAEEGIVAEALEGTTTYEVIAALGS